MTLNELQHKLDNDDLAHVYKNIQDEARGVIYELHKRREERKDGNTKSPEISK